MHVPSDLQGLRPMHPENVDVKPVVLDPEGLEARLADVRAIKELTVEQAGSPKVDMTEEDSSTLQLPQDINFCVEAWDTFLFSDCAKPIACTKIESETWMGWSRCNELENLDLVEESMHSLKMSPEEEEMLDQFMSNLTNEDFSLINQFLPDGTVQPIHARENGLVSDFDQHSPDIRDDMSDTMQPLDFSITSKMLEKTDFQHPSFDDLPELKPCPIVAAHNATCEVYMDEAVNLTMCKEVEISEKKERKKQKRTRKRKKIKDNLTQLSSPDVKPLIVSETNIANSEIILRLEQRPQVVPTVDRFEDAPQTSPTTGLPSTPPVLEQNGNRLDSPPQGRNSKRPGRRPGQPSRVYHLWEFLRDLLLNEAYCPSHIHWIDKMNGVFRIARSEDVAKLWGQRKRTKRNMTYEKMSRAIRFSRAAGYFGNLPKNGNYPKKLCFKFGLRCQDWIDQSESIDIPVRAPKEQSSAPDSKVANTSKLSENDKQFPLKKRKYNFTT